MESKILLSAILILSSWVFVGSSQGLGLTMPCMSKLLPCQDYLHPSKTTPPSTCCDALKDLIKGDQHCLCDIFNNAELMNTFNVTTEQALEAPKACGVPVDIKMCESSSDGEESALPPSVAKAFEEYEKHLDAKNANSKDAPKTDAESTPANDTASAPTTNVIPKTVTPSSDSGIASFPSLSPSQGPTSSTSGAEKGFTRGFGVFIFFVITWMTLFI
ncbi:non-specific lipid transfer protein GPI-anchored 3-like [Magnolia sinica]|uniref:non-specific lipid transfer protein GPI-anchored 3-like n=1 Tax=Magnolia sinica TaxID=86752 RepID=UPI0026583C07|nr:non-specific lipid transfer protein GPI-anchored 3-like [Magnolia sinica]